MPYSLRSYALVVVLSLQMPFGLAQQAAAPPACNLPKISPLGSRPPSPRPSAEAIEATLDSDASDPSVLTAAEPANFAVARYRLMDYYDCVGSSGCYWTDLDAQARRADAELTRLLAAHNAITPEAARAQKLAMVLDIDETSLSSYCEEKRENFGYIAPMFEAWIVSPEASIPIQGTLRLFNHARSAGVSVFFITGRPGKGIPGDQTDATARNLTLAGYKDWQGLVLRDASERTMATTLYKSSERAKIAKNYRIILNMGDQWSDLDGDPRAEISVKLPNPFYYLP